MPISVPEGTKNVILEGINLNKCRKGRFHHLSWKDVRYSQIHSNAGSEPNDNAFSGLHNLQHLKLKGQLRHRSFEGLSRLEEVDLSDNDYLWLRSVLNVLNETRDTTLPV